MTLTLTDGVKVSPPSRPTPVAPPAGRGRLDYLVLQDMKEHMHVLQARIQNSSWGVDLVLKSGPFQIDKP